METEGYDVTLANLFKACLSMQPACVCGMDNIVQYPEWDIHGD